MASDAITLISNMSNIGLNAGTSGGCHNRLAAIMTHVTRYNFRGGSRLAADAGIAKSTISQLLHGRANPLYITVQRIVKVLGVQLGRQIHPEEVFSENGKYPTSSVCLLTGCPGCLPDSVYENDGSLKIGSESVLPGMWTGDIGEFSSRIKKRTIQ